MQSSMIYIVIMAIAFVAFVFQTDLDLFVNQARQAIDAHTDVVFQRVGIDGSVAVVIWENDVANNVDDFG